jgi:chromosome segregation ATPase
MWVTKVKIAIALLAATTVIGAGGGVAAYRALAAGPANTDERVAVSQTAATSNELRDENTRLKEELNKAQAEAAKWKGYFDKFNDQYNRMSAELQDFKERSRRGLTEEERARIPASSFPASKGTVVQGATTTSQTGADRYFADVHERLSDDVELLKAQLEAKQAELRGAEMMLATLEHGMQRMLQMANSGVVSEGTIEKAKQEVVSQKAQLLVKRAELKETQLRLKHALRRLENAPPPQKPPAKAESNAEQQLKALGSKLEALRRDLDSLRRQLQSQQ